MPYFPTTMATFGAGVGLSIAMSAMQCFSQGLAQESLSGEWFDTLKWAGDLDDAIIKCTMEWRS